MANYPLSALSQHRQARRVRPRGRTWALPLASVLLLHAPLVGAGEGGWRVCGVPGRMEAARGTAGGFLREGGWERGLAGGAGQRGELLRLRGGRKKGEVEGESGSAPAESDDDPMKNDPPPDRMRYTGGVRTLAPLLEAFPRAL
ncbi:hypothetical protein T484DRAFT_1915886 [Baffinella frigidus]|nr:hypothetical protein T484DRAFT_1915886 [Cryptophyta sp. CCMP2293]